MNYSSTFEVLMRNPVRFQDPFQEHVSRLTGSPRGNAFLGLSQRRVQIMRAALLHRLNAREPLTAGELGMKMNASNCPFWLAEMSVVELMNTLAVKLEGSELVPSPPTRWLFSAEPHQSTRWRSAGARQIGAARTIARGAREGDNREAALGHGIFGTTKRMLPTRANPFAGDQPDRYWC